ncbi:MAG: NADPH-dependent glutamate synthase [Bacteroidales bacterium]|jgi:glutamate synthase (NADPH/NADH) small chain|nr:NADPH-dependent glutamate synthase [Bacteroidales bacterium]
MYRIVRKECLAPDTILLEVEATRVAKVTLPGQFVIVIADQKSERIPLTICDCCPAKGTITLVIKSIGFSTRKISEFQEGEYFRDIVGPLGNPCEWLKEPLDTLRQKQFVFVGGGVGIAPVYPQIKWLYEHGIQAEMIIGARTRQLLILEKESRKWVSKLYVTTDDGSGERQGLVSDILDDLIIREGKQYDQLVAIGPLVMMKAVVEVAKKHRLPSIVSLNSIMLDGTGMCGACRVRVDGQTRFTCVDGPEFDGYKVDFETLLLRQKEIACSPTLHKDTHTHTSCECLPDIDTSAHAHSRFSRVPVREQSPATRISNFDEVCLGYNAEEAQREALRCFQCKKPPCVNGCPVKVNIPDFIKFIAEGQYEAAARALSRDTALPAVCGRVCPQETQCEQLCIAGKKGDAIAIGKLERFAADWAREKGCNMQQVPQNATGKKVAIVGSGPAGLTCARELLSRGHAVTIFEALHELGGVLVYGIPPFRLPKESVVQYEIQQLIGLGARFERDCIIGKTVTVNDLLENEGYDAVFIGSGAGLPNFMNIPGENLNGVVSANEFLTRNNLLQAYKEDYDTPVKIGHKVVVVGGGNVAMDAARTAIRLGAETHLVYRRGESELPARAEEVHHAKEEGLQFHLLSNPVEILGEKDGSVKAIRCARMQLGTPDASGRRRPEVIPDADFTLDTDFVIMAIGTSPNPLISNTTQGLEVNKWKCIVADENTGQTSLPRIFAGGDAVSGAATVILAMGAGKNAAQAIDKILKH